MPACIGRRRSELDDRYARPAAARAGRGHQRAAQAQTRAIAELIDREHRTTTPGEGQRWALFGPDSSTSR